MAVELSREQTRAADLAFVPFALVCAAMLIATRVLAYLADRGELSVSPSVNVLLAVGALMSLCVGFYVRNRLRRRFSGAGR